MMQPLPRLLVFVLGLTVLLLVINLVRKRQLQERYAMLWLLAVVGLLLIIFQLSLTISRSQEHLKVLTQELGLLRSELAAMRHALDAVNTAGDGASLQENPTRDEFVPDSEQHHQPAA